jgi:hypothetical protein
MRLGMCKRVETLKKRWHKTESTITFRSVFGKQYTLLTNN